MGRFPRAVAVGAIAVLAAASGCTRDHPEDDAAARVALRREALPQVTVSAAPSDGRDTVYATAHRLVRTLDPPLPATEPEQCAVADEFRLALGCLESLPLGPDTKAPRPEDGLLSLEGAVPRRFWGKPMLIEPRLRGEPIAGFKPAPPQVVESGFFGFEIDTTVPDLDGNDDLEVQLRGYVVPPADRSFTTPPLEFEAGDQLVFGTAFNEIGVAFTEGPVRFRVLAIVDQDAAPPLELFATTLDPASWDGAWIDQRVDLAPLAGKTARLRLHSSPVSGDGMAFPLWGSPDILRRAERGPLRNLILISLDTWRHDHFDTAVSGGPVTPELAALAREGVVFEQAVTTYPSTSASHMSLFTGLYPITHQVRFANDVLGTAWPTLAEILGAEGYQTGAVTENAMLLAEAGFMFGFDSYFENKGLGIWSTEGQIDSTLERGRKWLREHDGERFFLFLHTYQIHSPYEPPEEYFFPPTESERASASEPAWITDTRHRYAGEVRYADVALARFLRELHRSGVLDRSIVVLTSDHGEEFAEHGQMGHSKSVYDEVLRVPLLVWAPGLVRAGTRVESMISLVDVVPTVLDLLDVNPPKAPQGQSLRGALEDREGPPSVPRFAEGPDTKNPGKRLVAVRTDRHKWIAREGTATPHEIYDLRADPGETRSIDDDALREVGRRHLESYASMSGGASPKRDLDARTTEKLRALGYVE